MKYSERFQREFTAHRIYLMSVFPFYASLLQHFRVIETEGVETAAVSADDRIFINPVFWHGLGTAPRRAFVTSHEILHPALGIFWRGAKHDRDRSNRAHDYVINLILKDEDSEWVWPQCLLDEKYRGMNYEEVYASLKEDEEPQPSGGEGVSVPGVKGQAKQNRMPDILTVDEANALDPEGATHAPAGNSADDMERRAKEWIGRLMVAQLAARAQGRSSLAAEMLLGLAKGGTVPWQEKLRMAIAETNIRSSVEWSLPGRRSDAVGCFMPRELMNGVDVTVYVDTSASISKQNLESAVREIADIIDLSGGSVRWLEGDAAVLKDEWIHAAPEQLIGGGGTSFVPLFDHLADRPTKTLIIFTDTDGEMPDFIPPYPVIWAIYANTQAEAEARVIPFGESIAVPASAFA